MLGVVGDFRTLSRSSLFKLVVGPSEAVFSKATAESSQDSVLAVETSRSVACNSLRLLVSSRVPSLTRTDQRGGLGDGIGGQSHCARGVRWITRLNRLLNIKITRLEGL